MSIIKSLAVGEGDMFYINHNSDNFTIIDCCMSEDDRERIVKELKSQSNGKNITRFISTHPDDDHIRGLDYLHEQMNLLNFYCVNNQATKPEETDEFAQYCTLRDDPAKAFYLYRGCSRNWMNLNTEDRGSSGINILWPDTTNEHYQEALNDASEGTSWNNISPIVKYSLDKGASILWMGDLEWDFMEKVHDSVSMPSIDILFAPHHGRYSGTVPEKWLEQMDPKLIVIGEAPSEHLNYYAAYDAITQNSAGDIAFECETGKTHIYVSNWDYSVDFLEDEGWGDAYGKYIGTLKTK